MNVWTDKIFKKINIIEGTKKHNGNKTRFYTGKYFKETGSFYGTDIWRTGFTGNVWSSRSDNRGLVWNYRSNLVNLVVFTVTGLSLGITVLISRYIGEKKQERIGKVIGGVIWFFAILAVILTIALLLAAPVLAKLMQAPEAVLTSFLFSYMGYFNGKGKTLFVMAQGLAQTFLVRIPMSYFMSIQPDASLTKIGLAAPTATVFGIILCSIYFVVLGRKEKI